MICEYCGIDNDDQAAFCNRCGRSLRQKPTENALKSNGNDEETDRDNVGFSKPGTAYIGPSVISRKEEARSTEQCFVQNETEETEYSTSMVSFLSKRRKLISRAIFLTLVLAILYNLSAISKEAPYAFASTDAILALSDNSVNKTYIYNSEGENFYTIDSATIIIRYSFDYATAVLTETTGQALYYVYKNEVTKITGNPKFLNLSDDGRFLYFTTTDEDNSKLECYDAANKTQTTIASEKSNNLFLFFEFPSNSPNGKTYVFNKIYASTNAANDSNAALDTYEAFISINGKEPETLGENELVLAVSDDGEFIYYGKVQVNNVEFYVRHNGKDTKMDGIPIRIYFNKDYSEAIYSNSTGTYMIVDGQDNYKLCDSKLVSMLYPDDMLQANNFMLTIPVETFINKAFEFDDNSIGRIGRNHKSNILAGNVMKGSAKISRDGNSIIYSDRFNSIELLHDITGKCAAEHYIDQAANYDTVGDLSGIYYTDMEGNLYYKKGTHEPMKIDSGVSDLILNAEEDILFYIKYTQDGGTDGTLYCCGSDGVIKPVESLPRAVSLEEWNHGVIAKDMVNGIYNIYYNITGTDFKKFSENTNMNVSNLSTQTY